MLWICKSSWNASESQGYGKSENQLPLLLGFGTSGRLPGSLDLQPGTREGCTSDVPSISGLWISFRDNLKPTCRGQQLSSSRKNWKSPIFRYKIFLLKEIHLYLRLFKKKRMKSSFLRSDLDTSCYHWPLDFRHKASSPQEAPPVGLDWGQAWGIHGGWVPWIQDDVFNLWYVFKCIYWFVWSVYLYLFITYLAIYLEYIVYIYILICMCALWVEDCWYGRVGFKEVHTGSWEPYLVRTRCPSHISPYV